jgi:hypothetical protein
MALYRLLFVNRGHRVQFQEFQCSDDGQAEQAAARFSADTYPVELWRGSRRVKAFR